MEIGDELPVVEERRLRPRDEEQQKRWEWYLKEEGHLLDLLESGAITREEFMRRQAAVKMYLEGLATSSPKTELPNDRFFRNTLEAEIMLMGFKGGEGYVGFLDVDNLKAANSMAGHDGGDELLRAVAASLNEVSDEFTERLRESGQAPRIYPAHLSGDEFAILLSGVDKPTSREIGQAILEKITAKKSASTVLSQLPSDSAASIGFRSINGESDVDKSINEADSAMYVVKKRGKNQIAFFEDLSADEINAAKLKKS